LEETVGKVGPLRHFADGQRKRRPQSAPLLRGRKRLGISTSQRRKLPQTIEKKKKKTKSPSDGRWVLQNQCVKGEHTPKRGAHELTLKRGLCKTPEERQVGKN